MNNSRGQAFVETAIVLPFAFLLLFLVIELSIVFTLKSTLELATFRAARSYISLQSQKTCETIIKQGTRFFAFRSDNSTNTTVKISKTENKVTVSVTYLYKPLFPIYSLLKLILNQHSPTNSSIESHTKRDIAIKSSRILYK